MKKLISILVAVAIIVTAVPVMSAAATENTVPAEKTVVEKLHDFSNSLGNEKVSITDAVEILKYVAGITNTALVDGNEAFIAASAISGNEKPNINGAVQILKYKAGFTFK